MDSSEIFITGFGTGMFTGVISAYAIELMTWLISAELLPFFKKDIYGRSMEGYSRL